MIFLGGLLIYEGEQRRSLSWGGVQLEGGQIGWNFCMRKNKFKNEESDKHKIGYVLGDGEKLNKGSTYVLRTKV